MHIDAHDANVVTAAYTGVTSTGMTASKLKSPNRPQRIPSTLRLVGERPGEAPDVSGVSLPMEEDIKAAGLGWEPTAHAHSDVDDAFGDLPGGDGL